MLRQSKRSNHMPVSHIEPVPNERSSCKENERRRGWKSSMVPFASSHQSRKNKKNFFALPCIAFACLYISALNYPIRWGRSGRLKSQKPRNHPSPRIVDYLHLRNFNQNSTTRSWSISHRQVEYEEPQLLSSKDYLENRKSDFYQGEDGCIPLHAWQTATFPSCNTMHEIDARPSEDNFIFINCGSSRCTFLIHGADNSKAVLKTQRYRKSFSDYNFEMARVDGISMERLTKSKYITSIYGLCGASQITEFSEGGNIHDRIKEARLTKTDPISPLNKLKIGYQIATAVADMHSFESDHVTSLVHLDICCHQFIFIDGVYKLGDFHLSAFTRKHSDTGDICLEHPLTMHPKLRSPEEFYEHDNGGRIPLSNADVFMMGNVMYYVLTNRWLFEGFSNSVAKQKIMNGERSAIPTSIQQSKDRAIQILLKAIEMCWVHDYKQRPTAQEVASFIGEGLKEIEGHLDDNVVRLQMPSLPKNHRYTDSDFYSNIWN